MQNSLMEQVFRLYSSSKEDSIASSTTPSSNTSKTNILTDATAEVHGNVAGRDIHINNNFDIEAFDNFTKTALDKVAEYAEQVGGEKTKNENSKQKIFHLE